MIWSYLLVAVVFLTIGLRLKHKRFLDERQRRRDLEAKVDAYDRNAFATDMDQAGPAQRKPTLYDDGTVLFDGPPPESIDVDPAVICPPPILHEVEYDIVLDRPEPPAITLDGTVRVVEQPESRRPEAKWEYDVWLHTPCGSPLSVDDDGTEWCPTCGTVITHAGCPEAGGCRRPEQCESGCYWLRLNALNAEVEGEAPYQGPPQPRTVSD